jgi:hypothetical protein
MDESSRVGGLGGEDGTNPGNELAGSDLDAYLVDPVLLALLLSIVSLPIVAISLNVAAILSKRPRGRKLYP